MEFLYIWQKDEDDQAFDTTFLDALNQVIRTIEARAAAQSLQPTITAWDRFVVRAFGVPVNMFQDENNDR